jgi:uncharacterized protein
MRRSTAAGVAGALSLGAAVGFAAEKIAKHIIHVGPGHSYRHRLVSADANSVVLVADDETARPGSYGLYTEAWRAVVGDVLERDATRVRRRLISVEEGEVRPGKVAIGHALSGTPLTALSIDYGEPHVSTVEGDFPLWEISGRDDCWVILLHGYRGSRQSALKFLPLLRALDLSVLVVSYRNDEDAPASTDRRYHLGVSEWEEVEAAVAYAHAHGARNVVLFGWSMGAAIALQALSRMEHSDLVRGLVLDSPVLDWEAVLMDQARRYHLPAPIMRLALFRMRRLIGMDFASFDWVARAGELRVPVLVFHSSDDPTVPGVLSQAFAERRSDIVTLIDDRISGHFAGHNVDPAAYEAHVTAFLRKVFALDATS